MNRPRAAALVGALCGLLLLAPLSAPALAIVENGERPAPGLPLLEVIGIYVAIPLGLFLLISLLVVLPGLLRRPRYRPGRPWVHDPVWFAGPEHPEVALRDAVPRLQAKGGVGADW